ncbi:uncharacterized protein K452DRAFT_317040 [Aplosporella prunicola CBS 121167]|uniref:Peroxisome assembly protein 12 n=1 Tax=Aplosporella prunicola CBS 121167 TaxID=1176127 RepID=A0A6A6BJP9_9PEZI|nr:uncharacterized protein K452DRAFT_317040 [Aplosporella prunicola CBS 121167]KAF2143555.1 hypothetical protein K452DRAFT_317040 [Aplosporella prunicola CBS 121167]
MEFMPPNGQAGFDELKPSLFEILSEQQLSSLLPPSLRYLLALATHRHPRYLLPILNSFDEAYALVSLLVERHFLRTYGGSFTENFYGLKRERVLRIRGGEARRAQLGAPDAVRETLRLRRRGADVWKNLAVLVALPWLKRRLDEGWEVHAAHAAVLGEGGRFHRDEQQPGLRARVRDFYLWFLRRVYPSLNAAYYFALLAFNLAYLFDGTKYHSPFMWAIGTRIRRLNAADHRAIELATQPKPSASTRSSRPGRPGQPNAGLLSPRNLASTVGQRALGSLRVLLPTSIFLLKFLEWWHASDFARQLSRQTAADLELPPPVVRAPNTKPQHKPSTKHDEKAASAAAPPPQSPHAATSLRPILTVPLPASSALCPICVRPIVTPTASPYGYVYCYACIHRWVEGVHELQEEFMSGASGPRAPGGEGVGVGGRDSGENGNGNGSGGEGGNVWEDEGEGESREGKWESGVGRDAVTGGRVLGGVGGLRRVIV